MCAGGFDRQQSPCHLVLALSAALENLHAKYAVTAQAIEAKRDAEAAKLKTFLKELGYE